MHRVLLADYTTIGLGGPPISFHDVTDLESLPGLILRIRELHKNIPLKILGAGSNILFPDGSVRACIIRLRTNGFCRTEKAAKAEKTDSYGIDARDGKMEPAMDLRKERNVSSSSPVLLTVEAGQEWDALVAQTVQWGLSGLVCLSGIPGTVGAAPIQNIGAYGAELAPHIRAVDCLDLDSLKNRTIFHSDCLFSYRSSVFKQEWKDRLMIIRVHFQFSREDPPSLEYEELRDAVPLSVKEGLSCWSANSFAVRRKILASIRRTVLRLRKKKSMVIDARDPSSRSLGSFFVNPVLTRAQLIRCQSMSQQKIPVFPVASGIALSSTMRKSELRKSELRKSEVSSRKKKIPAAWLVEHSGFVKGQKWQGVGISKHHALALVNYGGTATQIKELACLIQEQVQKKFGIQLQPEVEYFF